MKLPAGSSVVLRGQTQTMASAYQQLFVGIALAVVLIYLLIVVNFQSWLDPFVIVSALPTALAGIVWMLFITRTTLSVPALTGAIMCMGVATANSILVVSFARERLAEGADAVTAAIDAGFTRFRPVLMTALAMIIGMAPMALSAELNAPLGRAVIGGLVCSTVATLLFVPAVFRLVHERKPSRATEPAPNLQLEGTADMNQESERAHASPDAAQRSAAPGQRRGARSCFFSVAAVAIAATGIVGRRHDDEQTRHNGPTSRRSRRSRSSRRKREAKPRELVLPGNVEAFYTASIHGQVSGYVRNGARISALRSTGAMCSPSSTRRNSTSAWPWRKANSPRPRRIWRWPR